MKKILVFTMMCLFAVCANANDGDYSIELLSGWACINGYDSIVEANGTLNNDYYRTTKFIGYSATRKFVAFNQEMNSKVTCIGLDSVILESVPKYDEKYVYNENGTYVYVNPEERVSLVLGDTIPMTWEKTKNCHTVMIYDFRDANASSENNRLLPFVHRGYSGYHNGRFIYTDMGYAHFREICEMIDRDDDLSNVWVRRKP